MGASDRDLTPRLLRARRIEAGLSIRAAARLIGASPSSIVAWESGRSTRNSPRLDDYAEALGLRRNVPPRGLIPWPGLPSVYALQRYWSRMSLAEVAERVGCSIAALQRYEVGLRIPPLSIADRIRRVLQSQCPSDARGLDLGAHRWQAADSALRRACRDGDFAPAIEPLKQWYSFLWLAGAYRLSSGVLRATRLANARAANDEAFDTFLRRSISLVRLIARSTQAEKRRAARRFLQRSGHLDPTHAALNAVAAEILVRKGGDLTYAATAIDRACWSARESGDPTIELKVRIHRAHFLSEAGRETAVPFALDAIEWATDPSIRFAALAVGWRSAVRLQDVAMERRFAALLDADFVLFGYGLPDRIPGLGPHSKPRA